MLLTIKLMSPGTYYLENCVDPYQFRSRGPEFDPGLVPYFRGDRSWNNFYGHSPPFRWIIQEGLLSVSSESMCTKYWLTACSSLPRKSVVRWTDRPTMTIAVDLGLKATKQTNKDPYQLAFGVWILYVNRLGRIRDKIVCLISQSKYLKKKVLSLL